MKSTFTRIICTALVVLLSIGLTIGQQDFNSIVNQILKESGIQNPENSYVINSHHTGSKTGKRHFYLSQAIDGKPIIGSNAIIVLNQDNTVAYKHVRFLDLEEMEVQKVKNISPHQAFVSMIQNTEYSLSDFKEVSDSENGKTLYNLEVGVYSEDIEVEEVYFPVGDKVVASYYSYIMDLHGHKLYTIAVSAGDATVLEQVNHAPECKVYPGYLGDRMLSHKPSAKNKSDNGLVQADGARYLSLQFDAENPQKGKRVIHDDPADPIYSPYGWHDDNGEEGNDYTSTLGNNVFSILDRDDDFSPDSIVDGGEDLEFIFDLDLALDPIFYYEASTTNLFTSNNFIHDVLAHNGFTEESGNFQSMNYTGVEGDEDPVIALCQNRAAFGPGNNATFFTPRDGESGVMRMFTWSLFENRDKFLRIEAPIPINRRYLARESSAGPSLDTTFVTGEVVLVQDSVNIFSDGCEPISDSLHQRIALLTESDSCSYNDQLRNVQEAGAIGAIFMTDREELPNVDFSTQDSSILIPSVLVTEQISSLLMDNLDSLVISLSDPTLIIDGSLDQGVIMHEFGHGLSNRLVGGKNNTSCLRNGEQMGEGWSDILAVMLTTKEEDLIDRTRTIGAYVAQEDAEGEGIRRRVYSTDMEINSYTYEDIKATGGQVHAMGEIWATVLFDLFYNMIDKYGFDADLVSGDGGNRKALQLVVEGLKYTACEPGFVDGRDGILAADEVLFNGENKCLIWETFARRGLGVNADQEDNDSASDGIEDFSMPVFCMTDAAVEKTTPQYVSENGVIDVEVKLTSFVDTLDSYNIKDTLPDNITFIEGSSEEITPSQLGNTLEFIIPAERLDENGEFTLNYQYRHTSSEELLKYDIDSIAYDTIIDVVTPNDIVRSNVSLSDVSQSGRSIQLSADFNGILQTATSVRGLSKPVDDALLVIDHRYLMPDNLSGTFISVSGEELDFENAGDNILVNGYSENVSSLFGVFSTWSGNSTWERAAIDLEPLVDGDSLYFSISQIKAGGTSFGDYLLDRLEVWDKEIVSSNICVEYENGSFCSENSNTIIEPAQVVNLTEINTDLLDVYPNPVTNTLNLESENIRRGDVIRILDISGKVMHRELISQNFEYYKGQINVSDLANGAYILEVRRSNKINSYKFIKQAR